MANEYLIGIEDLRPEVVEMINAGAASAKNVVEKFEMMNYEFKYDKFITRIAKSE